MLSISPVLKEMFYLWRKNFGFIAVITLITNIPGVFLASYIRQNPHEYSHFLRVIEALVDVLLHSINRAAIIGFLSKSLDAENVETIWNSIGENTWTLIRVSILLGLLCVPFFVGIGFVAMVLRPFHITVAIIAISSGIILLVFLKYALADPLVVVERLGARDALLKSWYMTRYHFGFVLGCYLVLCVITVPAGLIVHYFALGAGLIENGIGMILELFLKLLDSLWLVLAWCMYINIKETDSRFKNPVLVR
jgi:hypothetical protein